MSTPIFQMDNQGRLRKFLILPALIGSKLDEFGICGNSGRYKMDQSLEFSIEFQQKRIENIQQNC